MMKKLLTLISILFFFSCDVTEPDTIPPSISILLPISGQEVYEYINIEVEVTDNGGINSVEFFINDSLFSSDNNAPYEYQLNTTYYEDETELIINVIAYDNSNNSTQAQPIMVIVNNSSSYPEPINILNVSYNSSEMTFSITDITDNDFFSYELIRGNSYYPDSWSPCQYTNQDTSILIINEPETNFSITDFDPLIGQCYWIKSNDNFGLSTYGNKYFILDSAPNQIELNNIEYIENDFIISWSINNESDFYSYTLYESLESDFSDSTEIFNTINNEITQFIIHSPEAGELKYYKVVVEDIWGLQSISNLKIGSPWIRFTKLLSNNDKLTSLNLTSDNGYIVSTTLEKLIKLNMYGEIEWNATVAINIEYVNFIKETSDGGYLIVGQNNLNEFCVLKTDPLGYYQWHIDEWSLCSEIYWWCPQHHYLAVKKAFTAIETVENNFIIPIYTEDWMNANMFSNSRIEVIKVDNNGNIISNNAINENTYGQSSVVYSIEKTSNGGFVLFGEEEVGANSYSRYYISKIDENLNEVWSNSYSAEDIWSSVYGHSGTQSNDGGYISTGIMNGKITLVKTNSNGEEQFSISYEDEANSVTLGTGENPLYRVKIDNTIDEGYLITYKNGIMKVNSQFDLEIFIEEEYNNKDFTDSKQTPDGGYIIISNTYENGSYLIKTDPNFTNVILE